MTQKKPVENHKNLLKQLKILERFYSKIKPEGQTEGQTKSQTINALDLANFCDDKKPSKKPKKGYVEKMITKSNSGSIQI